MSLDTFILDHGIEHFTGREVLRMRRLGVVVDPPPESWWPRIIPTLRLAEALRLYLGHPLAVGNGYRPEPYNSKVGGARRSQHLYFRALDLDLPNGHKSREEQEAFYSAACELYLERGDELQIGLGLYRHTRGTRIHIDTGYRKRYWKRKFVKPILDGMR